MGWNVALAQIGLESIYKSVDGDLPAALEYPQDVPPCKPNMRHEWSYPKDAKSICSNCNYTFTMSVSGS